MPNHESAQVRSVGEAVQTAINYFITKGILTNDVPHDNYHNFVESLKYVPESTSSVDELAFICQVDRESIETPGIRTSLNEYQQGLVDMVMENMSPDTAVSMSSSDQPDSVYSDFFSIAPRQLPPTPTISFESLYEGEFVSQPVAEESIEEMLVPESFIEEALVSDSSVYNRPRSAFQRMAVGSYAGNKLELEVRSEKRRSDDGKMMNIIKGEKFPKPNFINNVKDLRVACDDWYRSCEYKDNWIFSRREREGFNRRNIGQFGLDDVVSKIAKSRTEHPLNTEHSKFYDWKLGGTDWILRLELFNEEDTYFLVSRYIYKPTNAEIKFDVRFWNGERFKTIIVLFAEQNNEGQYEHRINNINTNSLRPANYEEFECDDDEYDGDDD
jgi:hypothetical protein